MQPARFDRGFRPGSILRGNDGLGASFTDVFKKYTNTFWNPTPATGAVPAGTVPIVAPKVAEPTILGIPQSTAMWGGAALLGLGVIGALVYSQKSEASK
jgi:hypothetical protein